MGIKELINDQIVEVNGEKWVISKLHKTCVPFQVKLLDIPFQIIERYKAFQENNLVFPNLNYWSICKRMGKMIKECGITKKNSFHQESHGFAPLALFFRTKNSCATQKWQGYGIINNTNERMVSLCLGTPKTDLLFSHKLKALLLNYRSAISRNLLIRSTHFFF